MHVESGRRRSEEETICGLQSWSGGRIHGTFWGQVRRSKNGQEEPIGGLGSQNGGGESGLVGAINGKPMSTFAEKRVLRNARRDQQEECTGAPRKQKQRGMYMYASYSTASAMPHRIVVVYNFGS